MVALWPIGIEGETELEKATVYAAFKNDREPLIGILLDPNYELSFTDRVHLAQYLRGDYRNTPGRRPAHRKSYMEVIGSRTPAQLAADDVRLSMEHRRERGRSPHRWRKRCIVLYAKKRGANPDTVEGHLKRSEKDRAHRKRPRPNK
ncbi:hypothetical protein SAMN05216566_1354 [Aureimonas phyllosphaerae]|uniref:Uncharacterized protein n=1 Tax=Aureimonas phyllosphaerae TaxID=1166078 RepID=A0A7W6BTE0_9HYPH|nr:hypothetical protein [Aureimonas phyllosphaerae]MBB3960589.1 hypothetical protein [Aureimonas phyllosphaerae]SFF57844.1 hypothetical protein SAMN05216566_1354 [Aureimonas phyllosphaerae]